MAWKVVGEMIMDGRVIIGSLSSNDGGYRVEIGHHLWPVHDREPCTFDEAYAFMRGLESAQGQVKSTMAQLYMVLQANGGKARVSKRIMESFNASTATIETRVDLRTGDHIYEAGNV